MIRALAAALPLLLICGCKPISGDVANRTEHDVYVNIKGVSGARTAYGDLPAGTLLSMEDNWDEISEIRYSYPSRQCVIRVEDIRSNLRFDHTSIWGKTWTITLPPC